MSDPSSYTWNLDFKYYIGGDDITCKYDPTQIVQNDKQLVFNATYDGIYHTGYMSTIGKFSFQYGYAEIRCKAPQVPCLWSNFYLADDYNAPWPKLGEIDILQVLGVLDNSIAVHGGEDPAHHVQDELRVPPSDWHSEYHAFAADWQPFKIIWYMDGKEIFRSSRYTPKNPLYLYLSLTVNEVIYGQKGIVNPRDFPQIFDIDYVKVWRKL